MVFRTPWDEDPAPDVSPELPQPAPTPPKKRGRRPALDHADISWTDAAGEGGWLYHHLTITGPEGRVAAFAEAAQGSGIVPWRVGQTPVLPEPGLSFRVGQLVGQNVSWHRQQAVQIERTGPAWTGPARAGAA